MHRAVVKKKLQRDIIFIVSALAVLGLLFVTTRQKDRVPPVPPATIEEVGGLTQGYRNQEFNITLQYPEQWHGSEQVAGVIVKFVPKEYDFFDFKSPSLSIAVNDQLTEEEKTKNLNELVDANMQKLKEILDEMVVEKDEPVTIQDQVGRRITYIATLGPYATKITETKLLIGDRFYTLTYAAPEREFARYEEVAKEMATTFMVEK